MSYWETSSTYEAEVAPADVWSRAYADVAAWPKWNAEIRRAAAWLWRRILGPAASRALPDAQRAVVELAENGPATRS